VDICHEIKTPNGSKVAQIATGDYHSLLLTKDGDVLAFGDNSFGQLGMEFDPSLPFSDRPIPMPNKSLYRSGPRQLKINGIVAGGANSFLTVDVQQAAQDDSLIRTGEITSEVWTCGRGIWGALGNGKWTHLQDSLTKVKALSGLIEYDEASKTLSPIRLSDISVGTTHVSAILGNQTHLHSSTSSLEDTDDAGLDVLWWGGNEHFQLGTSKRSNLSRPTHINAPPEAASGDHKDPARLQIMPRHHGMVGKRSVKMRQRVECGRHTSAIYSALEK
jgi:nucleolar protein 9